MVRFRQAADAKAALDSAAATGENAGEVTVAGCSAQVKLVEGQEEEEFYKRVRSGFVQAQLLVCGACVSLC